LQGERVIILRTTLGAESASAPPGTVIAADAEGIRVATGDGEVIIRELQVEGRRPMSARDFLAGRPLRPGTLFEHGQL
jgi:methionyl-tRNA formyltransferase